MQMRHRLYTCILSMKTHVTEHVESGTFHWNRCTKLMNMLNVIVWHISTCNNERAYHTITSKLSWPKNYAFVLCTRCHPGNDSHSTRLVPVRHTVTAGEPTTYTHANHPTIHWSNCPSGTVSCGNTMHSSCINKPKTLLFSKYFS